MKIVLDKNINSFLVYIYTKVKYTWDVGFDVEIVPDKNALAFLINGVL